MSVGKTVVIPPVKMISKLGISGEMWKDLFVEACDYFGMSQADRIRFMAEATIKEAKLWPSEEINDMHKVSKN